MKFRLLLLIFWGLFSTPFLFGQTIFGKIIEENGASVEFASVLLYNASDTSLIKGSLSDEKGLYSFDQIPQGSYFINTAVVGLGKGVVPVFNYKGGELNLGELRLDPKTTELGEVTIVARKPIIEVKADRTILNVEGNLNASGQNALEVLRKAPGVTIDNNDNISLKGKNSVRFLVDGREVPLSDKDLADMLKNMRAEDIQSFEMITNPSAKYDASGNAGIINIRTKKNKNFGTNGSIGGNATYGESLKGGGNLSLNHRTDKLNIYTTYSNHFGDWHNTLNLYREQDGRVFDQSSKMKDNNNNHFYKLGADYSLSDKHSIGFVLNGSHVQGPWENQARTKISNIGSQTVDSILVAGNRQPQNKNNNALNLNYRFADTLGHELTVDLDKGLYTLRADSYQPNKYMDVAEQRILSQSNFGTITPTDIDIFTAKVDYEQNFWKGKLSTGAKMSRVKTDNLFDFFDEIDKVRVRNLDRSNRFIYEEQTLATYLNFNRQFKKVSVQAGLRLENTDYMGDLESFKPEAEDERVENNYTKLFPSAAVTYTMNEKNQFGLTFSRRIDRPSYRDLNPFEERLDELSFKKGNPFLRPQFTNSVELSHTFRGFLNTSLGYSHTNDMFTEIIDTAETKRTFLTNENIAQQNNFSLSISAPLPLAKWLEGYISVTGVHSSFQADFRPGFAYSAQFNSLNLYSEYTFRLPKDFSIQLSGWYNSPSIWGAVFRSKSQGAVDLAFQKKIMDGNGDIRLAFGDILGTAGWASVNDFTPGLYMKGSGTWESQTIRLTMNYRFGNKNVKSARKRTTGLEEESGRIKS